VWPESHKKMEALSRSNLEYYELIWTLNNDSSKIDLGEYIELTPKQEIFYFTCCLCVHSGSINNGKRPRLAMNMK